MTFSVDKLQSSKRLFILFSLLASTWLANAQAGGTKCDVGASKAIVSNLRVQTANGGDLLMLGTRHTNDAANPQIAAIKCLLQDFDPQEVITEGGDWPIAKGERDAVEMYGELAFAKYLGSVIGATLTDADPAISIELDAVAKEHGIVQTKMFYALRFVRQFNEERNAAPFDQKMSDLLQSEEINANPSWRSEIDSVKSLDLVISERLPQLPSWRSLPEKWLSAQEHATFLNDVARTSLAFRDRHTTELIVSRLKQGKRILVVEGLAHLDAQRKTLFQALRN